jgi:hypothetical protein
VGQNGLDHVIFVNEVGLRRVLASYVAYPVVSGNSDDVRIG